MNFSLDADDESILGYIDHWCDLLAKQRYAAALAAVHGGAEPNHWNPELLEKVINGYGLPEPHPCGEVFVVTERTTAKGKQHHREIQREDFGDPHIGDLWYDLPLNGEWSDLTAAFDLKRDGSQLGIVLDQVHVF